MFTSPGADAIQIGNLIVHWYGIMIALAFLVGVYTIQKVCDFYKDDKLFFKENDTPPQDYLMDLSIVLLISAIFGARLYYCIFDWRYFSHNISEIFQIWQGGISIHGAILGGFIGGLVFCARNKLNWQRYADVVSVGLVLGQSIGRWGNFFNSEAFGAPTNLPWKLYIPAQFRPETLINYEYFHPTFLYESLLDFTIFLILVFYVRRKLYNYRGGVFFTYLILYSIVRFFIEGLRIDSIYYVFGLPLAQFISILLLIVSILSLIRIKYCNKILDKQSAFT